MNPNLNPVRGENLKHHWTKETEDECIALAKRGADFDEIAVIIDLRPGQVRHYYGKVIDRELALLNLEVEEAMYRNANGVKLPDTHVSVHVPQGGEPIVTKVALVKHYPPNVAAGQFILKNRRPGAWKDEPAVIVSRDDAAAAIRARVKEMKEAGG